MARTTCPLTVSYYDNKRSSCLTPILIPVHAEILYQYDNHYFVYYLIPECSDFYQERLKTKYVHGVL